jgi:hypothetical protein
MKITAICIICFVIAFLLGRWTPNYDLQVSRLQIKDLELKLEQGEKGSNTQVTSMLGFRPPDDPAPRSKLIKVESTETTTNETKEVEVKTEKDETPRERRRRNRDRPAEERLDEAIELWELRTELAKTTFMDKLDAGKEDILDFNVLMESLNLRTEAAISNWVEKVEHKENITSEDGARLFSEILNSVVLTYDEMDRKLPENWRSGVDDDFQLMEMIDPRVAKPLLKLEDRMGGIRFF